MNFTRATFIPVANRPVAIPRFG